MFVVLGNGIWKWDLQIYKYTVQKGLSSVVFIFSIGGLKTSIQVNDGRLRTAGEASQRSTKEDWAEWMRHFSIQLLKESPSPALRTCARLAQLQVPLTMDIIHCGISVFLSDFHLLSLNFTAFCWARVVCSWICQLLGAAKRN